MPDRSTEGRERVWRDPGYVGHVQWHPGLWGWKRSCQTSKGLCCLTVAFILQQQNTIADVEIGEFPHQIYAFQAGSWSKMGGRKASSWEAVVMVEGQPGGCGERSKGRAWLLTESVCLWGVRVVVGVGLEGDEVYGGSLVHGDQRKEAGLWGGNEVRLDMLKLRCLGAVWARVH